MTENPQSYAAVNPTTEEQIEEEIFHGANNLLAEEASAFQIMDDLPFSPPLSRLAETPESSEQQPQEPPEKQQISLMDLASTSQQQKNSDIPSFVPNSPQAKQATTRRRSTHTPKRVAKPVSKLIEKIRSGSHFKKRNKEDYEDSGKCDIQTCPGKVCYFLINLIQNFKLNISSLNSGIKL